MPKILTCSILVTERRRMPNRNPLYWKWISLRTWRRQTKLLPTAHTMVHNRIAIPLPAPAGNKNNKLDLEKQLPQSNRLINWYQLHICALLGVAQQHPAQEAVPSIYIGMDHLAKGTCLSHSYYHQSTRTSSQITTAIERYALPHSDDDPINHSGHRPHPPVAMDTVPAVYTLLLPWSDVTPDLINYRCRKIN